MSPPGWSLRRRTALSFAATATVFLAVVGIAVAASYRVVLANELDEELLEQLEEVRARYVSGPGGALEFERLVGPTGLESAETPMAWRALETAGGAVWGPHGPPRLVERLAEAAPAPGRTVRPTESLRRRRDALAPGLEVDVLLDGTEWLERLDTVALAVLAIVLAGSSLSLVAGLLFAQRLAAMLERVAGEVADRDARAVGRPVELPGAPREIRAVVEAIEETLRVARGENERARVLLAGLAHDLRAPVQSLLTSTQVALLGRTSDAATRSLLEDHLDELRSLARTIDNLVAWGAPRLDARGEERIAFDLGGELETRLRAEEEEAARRGVFLDLQRGGDLSLRGDPSALVLAVRNLVNNAVAWSPPAGQVLVRLAGRDGEVVVSVEDDGPGVPPAERRRVFEPFVRGAAAPGRRAGYGLGLAIVAFVVDRHGGRVHVEDAPSGGARFVVRLPRRPQPAGDAGADAARGLLPLRGGALSP